VNIHSDRSTDNMVDSANLQQVLCDPTIDDTIMISNLNPSTHPVAIGNNCAAWFFATIYHYPVILGTNESHILLYMSSLSPVGTCVKLHGNECDPCT